MEHLHAGQQIAKVMRLSMSQHGNPYEPRNLSSLFIPINSCKSIPFFSQNFTDDGYGQILTINRTPLK